MDYVLLKNKLVLGRFSKNFNFISPRSRSDLLATGPLDDLAGTLEMGGRGDQQCLKETRVF